MRKVAPHEVTGMDENEFVILNEKLVHSVCKKAFSDKVKRETGLDYEDLYQVGVMAMVKAKRGFKPEYGYQFSTYAIPKIKGEMQRHILLNSKVHVPRPIREAYFKITKAGLLLEDDEVIAEQLGISVRQVKRAKLLRTDVSSLQETINDEAGDAIMEDWLTTEESAADVAESNLTVQEFLATLSDKEKAVWLVYSRTNGNQRSVGEAVGVSQVQVSRILKKIFTKAEKFGERLRVGS